MGQYAVRTKIVSEIVRYVDASSKEEAASIVLGDSGTDINDAEYQYRTIKEAESVIDVEEFIFDYGRVKDIFDEYCSIRLGEHFGGHLYISGFINHLEYKYPGAKMSFFVLENLTQDLSDKYEFSSRQSIGVQSISSDLMIVKRKSTTAK